MRVPFRLDDLPSLACPFWSDPMDETSRVADAAPDDIDNRLDWASAPGNFRRSHQALLARHEELSKQLADVRALQVENAALRAGLDPDAPGVAALLASYTGPAEPAAVLAFHDETLASVLAGVLDRGGAR